MTVNSLIIEYQAASLTCDVRAAWGETLLWFSWTSGDGQKLKQESISNLLVLNQADVTRDNKMMYYCTVRNVAGSEKSDPYLLDVHCKYLLKVTDQSINRKANFINIMKAGYIVS